jgi:hypothetical protein
MNTDTRLYRSPLRWRRDARALRLLSGGLGLPIEHETLVLAWLFGCDVDRRVWTSRQRQLCARARAMAGGGSWS